MTIEMLDAFDDAVAFSHAGAGSQGDCVALLSAADLSMGVMGIAPGRAAVDEGFKLAGNVRPIGGSNRDDAVCPLKFVDDFVHVVMLDTLRGVVTGAAAFAEAETVIINADAFERIFFPQTLGDDFHNFRSCTVSHRTAVYHQSIHIFPPSFKNSKKEKAPETELFRKIRRLSLGELRSATGGFEAVLLLAENEKPVGIPCFWGYPNFG